MFSYSSAWINIMKDLKNIVTVFLPSLQQDSQNSYHWLAVHFRICFYQLLNSEASSHLTVTHRAWDHRHSQTLDKQLRRPHGANLGPLHILVGLPTVGTGLVPDPLASFCKPNSHTGLHYQALIRGEEHSLISTWYAMLCWHPWVNRNRGGVHCGP